MDVNRAKKRKLNKLLSKMDENDKKHLLMATQQDAVHQALKKVTPDIILQGMHTAYINLYDTFLSEITSDKLTNEQKNDKIQKMIDLIATRYMEATIRKEEEKKKSEIIRKKEGK